VLLQNIKLQLRRNKCISLLLKSTLVLLIKYTNSKIKKHKWLQLEKIICSLSKQGTKGIQIYFQWGLFNKVHKEAQINCKVPKKCLTLYNKGKNCFCKKFKVKKEICYCINDFKIQDLELLIIIFFSLGK